MCVASGVSITRTISSSTLVGNTSKSRQPLPNSTGTNLDRLPAETTASSSFTYDSNCVKTAFAGSFITNPGSSPFEACAYEKTWADYNITIETPTKQVASRRVKLQQTSSPNIYAITFEGQCQGGSVGCSSHSQTAQAAGSHALTITFNLGPCRRDPLVTPSAPARGWSARSPAPRRSNTAATGDPQQKGRHRFGEL
jgi:hypothetical protein